MTDQPLAAPEPLSAPSPLTLTVPEPTKPVAETAAPKMAPPVDPAVMPTLDKKVDEFLHGLTQTEVRSPEFARRAADVRTMGDAEIRAAAETSNRLLKSPVRALNEGGVSKESKVGRTLMELRRTVEDLDPSEASVGRKFLGVIPFGDKIQDYFRRYESAQGQLNAIIQSLYNGRRCGASRRRSARQRWRRRRLGSP